MYKSRNQSISAYNYDLYNVYDQIVFTSVVVTK